MDLSQATDELLAAPWEAFVETRTRLADQLAGAGRREDSRVLKKIRRPTASAWATNQVVRRARAAVDAYLAASDELRLQQAAMLRGGDGGARAAYQAAAEAFRQATAALTQAARQALGQGGREPDRAQLEGVVANVRAAALADDRRAELLAGRLLADLPAGEGGLEGIFGASLAASAAATAPLVRSPAPGAAPPAGHRAPEEVHAKRAAEGQGDREAEAHAKREAEARAKREEHARLVAAAVQEESAARDAAAAAGVEAQQARAAREQAEEGLRDAEAAAAKARQALQEAKTALQAAEHVAKARDAAADRAARHRQALEKRAPR